MDSLVSTEWLSAELGASDLRVVDASWHMDARDAAAEYDEQHIPGAVFMDLGGLADSRKVCQPDAVAGPWRREPDCPLR